MPFPPAPSTPRAVVIQGHSNSDSFSHALANAWTSGALEAGALVETLHLSQLDFDPIARGYGKEQSLEPDLVKAQQLIADAAHVVVAFPVWWGGTPALLKGFFDRALTPNFAFAYKDGWPVKGLSGRSGRMLVTMDSPVWSDRWLNGNIPRRQVGSNVLGFCGIAPVRTSAFGSLHKSDAAERQEMLAQAKRDGQRDGRALVRQFGRTLTASTAAS